MEFDLTISIVLYKNPVEEITNLLNCITTTALKHKIIIVDNSPVNTYTDIVNRLDTEYYFSNKNLGPGRAQNFAIQKILGKSKYHLITNPDILFEHGTLENIYNFLENNPDIGQVMPKVFYSDGNIQRLCKLLPHPLDLISRRFFNYTHWAKQRNSEYELKTFNYDKILDTPNLSGCFMFLRTSCLEEVGGFDTRFFMYLEDFDFTRRLNKITRTVFYPGATVFHAHKKGSYKNIRLLYHHSISAIKYFNKWGWLYDKERGILNKKVLSQL
ncbi:glycosyltransferase family 2 protein [Panacibacter sp. DH6]|uniref:Glycosyltransferase family 2 protein n=1 Tax=Panacibacter microcysteis TaxID=2793269 RepID=A0A931GUU2_9BACT|nr:glycosyltransferase family 2 protein [Panacibacter microcysteis]MBG9375730.1 glycosyltransferase family 2 protein [Panacibacter microcysteis]